MLSAKSESVKSFHESFYGTPSAEEGRWRRGKKRQPIPKEEPQNEVAVIGVHYRSFDDDSMAAFVNSATALVPWNGDSKLLIDRYDVRHLLQDLTGIRRRRARPPSPDATKEELDYERYRDVEGLENPSTPPEDEVMNGNATGGGYQRVGFDYSADGDQSIQKERVEEAIFSPPFHVPEHLLLKLPTSTKVHQIMAGTAKYIIEHGGQAEIVLRVKQANNPTFGFLMPDHYHHEYFRFLVEHPEHVGIGSTAGQVAAEVSVEVSSEDAQGGLSLLGTAYGDADEDEDDEVGATPQDQVTDEVAALGEVSEIVDNQLKECSDSNSNIASTTKRSSSKTQDANEGIGNATKDSGDPPEDSKVLGSTVHEGLGEGMTVGETVEPSSGMQEPAPPGTETFGSEGARLETHDLSEEPQVHSYKEPPFLLRRIIDKMVEFISRNGKEFEAIVRERDKSDGRFPFFMPWNEYYPYYSQALEAARQVKAVDDSAGVGASSTMESESIIEGKLAEKEQVQESFLNAVPYWDHSWTVESNGGKEPSGMSAMPDYKVDKSHNGEGGMGFDAVLAAVRVATRGHVRAPEGEAADQLRVSNGHEHHEVGSDEAVLAAVRAATRGSKLDPVWSGGKGETGQAGGLDCLPGTRGLKLDALGSGGKGEIVEAGGLGSLPAAKESKLDALGTEGKGEIVEVGGLGGLTVSATGDQSKIVVDWTSNDGGNKRASSFPWPNVEIPSGMEVDNVVVAKAAAVAAAEEGESVDAQLTAAEKRKAERLKRAKLFAAMIKDGSGLSANAGQGSGSLGLSGGLNQVGVMLETIRVKSCDGEPEGRDQISGVPLLVRPERDEEPLDTSAKEKKRKVKSKDQEEKVRKHHHRRKKNTEDTEKHSTHLSDAGEKGKDENQDHYQEWKWKDRRHGHELDSKEGKSRDSARSHDSGRTKENRLDYKDYYQENGEGSKHRTHVLEGKRKEKKHGHDAEQNNVGSRHDQNLDERESRYWHDSEERRREWRLKQDVDQKRESKHDQDYEEKQSRSRYGHDSDKRKERSHSHGKRRKHRDNDDESDDRDGKDYEQRSKKRRRSDGISIDEDTCSERQNRHRQEAVGQQVNNKKVGDVAHQDLQAGTDDKKVGSEKDISVLTPDDIPDDIRAKVRAILALM